MKLILTLVLVLVGVMSISAQNDAPRPVTYDDINAVARRMFCPECENIPLDKCFTSVCIQWKQDIGAQLAAGVSADDIVAGFVTRFGDQVVGVPQDPFLRNLALIAPTLFVILAAMIGFYAIRSRVQQQGEPITAKQAVETPENSPRKITAPTSSLEAKYLAQLQQDVDRE
jgi:cytochrome c-type biogenesis protein CcmH